MIQPKRWKDLTFDQTEVTGNVGPFCLVNDDGMTHGVGTVFVGPGVEGREIEVIDFFSGFDLMVKVDGVGSSTVERVPGFESGDEVEGFDQALKVVIFFLELFPFTLPHDHYIVALSEKTVFFEFGGLVEAMLRSGLCLVR